MKTKRILSSGTLALSAASICAVLSPFPQPTATAAAAARTSVSATAQILQQLELRKEHFTLHLAATNVAAINRDVKAALQQDSYLSLAMKQWSVEAMSSGSSVTATFNVQYWEDAAQYRKVEARVRQIIKQIVKPGMDDFQKEKVIHDYVVLHVAYDQSQQSYSAYDALFKGTTVCQGYAMLTYQLLKAAGVDNLLVVGTAWNSLGREGHAWNEVKLHGKWYQLDTTWDDPVPDVKGRVTYGYFNLTSAQMARNHSWNHSGLPVATANYIAQLQSSTNQADKALLTSTGLFVEEPKYTYNSLVSLQTMLLHQQPGTYSFRFPYADVNNLSNLHLLYSAKWSIEQDPRDAKYAIIVMKIGNIL